MLHDDGHVGFDDRGEIDAWRDRRGIPEFIQSQVLRSRGGDGESIRTYRSAVFEIYHNLDVRVVLGRCIEETKRLVTDHLRRGAIAPGRNVSLGNRPPFASHGFAHR